MNFISILFLISFIHFDFSIYFNLKQFGLHSVNQNVKDDFAQDPLQLTGYYNVWSTERQLCWHWLPVRHKVVRTKINWEVKEVHKHSYPRQAVQINLIPQQTDSQGDKFLGILGGATSYHRISSLVLWLDELTINKYERRRLHATMRMTSFYFKNKQSTSKILHFSFCNCLRLFSEHHITNSSHIFQM